MYLRTTSRTNKDGSKVEYLSIAHNYRVPGTNGIQAKVLHNLGRKAQIDVAELRRLVPWCQLDLVAKRTPRASAH